MIRQVHCSLVLVARHSIHGHNHHPGLDVDGFRLATLDKRLDDHACRGAVTPCCLLIQLQPQGFVGRKVDVYPLRVGRSGR